MPLDQITERIARVLQALNLDCLYHNQDDDCMDDEEVLPGRVDCKSKDSDLKFVVQLWRSHTQEIVVEVQRRRGRRSTRKQARSQLASQPGAGQRQQATQQQQQHSGKKNIAVRRDVGQHLAKSYWL